MTGILIVLVTALLLALALEPARRKARREGLVSPTSLPDRDRDRVTIDLRQRCRQLGDRVAV